MLSRVVVGYDETERSADARALAQRLAELVGSPLIDPGPVSPEVLHRLNAEDGGGVTVIGSTPRALPGTVLPATIGRRILSGPRNPVAIAPLGFARSAPEQLHQIGVAYDGTLGAKAALALATELAGPAGTQLELMAVAEPPLPVVASEAAATGHSAPTPLLSPRTRLKHAVSEALSSLPPGIGAVDEAVYGIPTRTLLDRTAALDLMVLGATREVGSGRPLGSVCEGLVLGGASCPLMIAPLAARRLGQDRGAAAGNSRTVAPAQR